MSAPPVDRNIWRGVKVALFVTLAGPPIGALLLLALGTARVGLANGFGTLFEIGAAGLFSTVLWISMFSYVFGGVPALISGVALGFRAAKGQPSGVLVTLAIVAVALLMAAALYRLMPLRDEPAGNAFALVGFLTPLAVASALVCRWLMIKIRLLPRI